MYQVQAQPIQPTGGGGGWKALEFLTKKKKEPEAGALTPQQQQAFQQGAGPVSQLGAQNYLNNSFNSRVFDAYGSPLQGQPSMYDMLMKIQRGGY